MKLKMRRVLRLKKNSSSKLSKTRRPAHSHPGNFFVPIVKKAMISVVSLRAKSAGRQGSPVSSFLHSLLFPGEEEDVNPSESLGTGFIIHPEGYILTSEHVIQDAGELVVRLYNGKRCPAKVIWRDEQRDLGVIRISAASALRPLPIGSSAGSKVGEMVISIGNPLGLSHSITTGVISAKNRQIGLSNSRKLYEDIIQTDCAINPGNSGGPLINLNGQVIGMNAFVVKDNQGLGFAIGIDSIKQRIGHYLPR
jgi:serine protease Do